MIVFLNGSFGVGKTSAARALKKIVGGAIYNPELSGGAILRLPDWFKLTSQNSGDYQDMPLWRNTTVRGIRAMRLLSRTVIVPMAFTNRVYLSEIIGKVRSFDPDVRHFCLVAPLEVVEARLRRRGDAPKHLDWQMRRAKECCAAHASEDFAERIDAETLGASQIAARIAAALN